MMNKKFLKTILFGGLFLSLTGAFVSCAEDYSDDIQNLQTQITTNSNAIAELQALLAKGVVITSVEKNAEGILLTLSDGSTQQLTNGADGKDGQNGTNGTNGENGKDADVWTIGTDGYWYKNDVKTEYKAVGQDGKDGQDGTSTNGTNGANGKDGGYYRPNAETGCFDYVDADGKVTPTEISWASSSLTAVQTETGVLFSGIAGAEDGLFISTVAELKSLVFQPQLVVDGVNAIKAGVLMHNGAIICTPNVTASYHLNPSTVNENGIDKESLQYVLLTKDFKVTRAISDVTASYNNISNGMLTVNVGFKGIPSTGAKIDLIALQAENASGEVITSDYATVDTDPIHTSDFIISRKQIITTAKDNAHYWPTVAAAQEVAKNEAAAATVYKATTDARIIAVDYNKTIDLDDHVRVCFFHDNSHSEFTKMEDYHLSIEYTKEKFMLTGMEDGLKVTTDQAEFIKLAEGGIVTPTTYQDGDQLRSSIGRTPVIKAELVHNEGGKRTVIQTKYVVLEIVDETLVDEPEPDAPAVAHVYDITTSAFSNYNMCTGSLVEITAEQMNTVYSKEGLSKEEFAAEYEFLTWADGAVKADGKSYRTSKEVAYAGNLGQITTFGLTWSLDADYIWANAGKTPKAQAVYANDARNKFVVINLTAGAPLAEQPKVELPADGEKFVEMWTNDLTLGMFNVRVPNVNESDYNNCTFVNNILTLYLDQKDPATLVSAAIANSAYKVSTATGVLDTNVEYIIKDARCEGYSDSKFTIKNDGKELYYNGALICTLDGTIVTLNSDHADNAMAEELLNTNKLIVTYAVKAEYESCRGIEPIPANCDVEFDVRYVRPLNVKPEAVGYFQDGNDFGGEGTLIEAAKVVSLMDWRGYDVPKWLEEGVIEHPYWGYYGVKRVTVDNSGVTCNIEAGKNLPLPSNIKAGIVDAAAKADADLATGLADKEIDEWFYYKNNGTVLVEDIEINFPVVVEYWWGKVVTDTVTVTVKATKRVNAPASK